MTLYSDLGMSVKMRLYTLQKRHVLGVFICFLASFFLALSVGLFGKIFLSFLCVDSFFSFFLLYCCVIIHNTTNKKGPNMLNSKSLSAVKINKNANMKTGPFSLVTPYLGKFHQQIWITAKPIIVGRNGTIYIFFDICINRKNSQLIPKITILALTVWIILDLDSDIENFSLDLFGSFLDLFFWYRFRYLDLFFGSFFFDCLYLILIHIHK